MLLANKDLTFAQLKFFRSKSKKIILMGNILYVFAVILIICWLVGFLAFHAGYMIHTLLVLALIVLIVRVIQGRKVV